MKSPIVDWITSLNALIKFGYIKTDLRLVSLILDVEFKTTVIFELCMFILLKFEVNLLTCKLS